MIDALVVLLVVLPPFDWIAAVILARISRQHPDILTLRERAVGAAIAAVAASIAAVLAWVRIFHVAIASEFAIIALGVALVLVSAPSLFWLVLLATGRFELGE